MSRSPLPVARHVVTMFALAALPVAAQVDSAPVRVVTLGGSVTETVVALGAEHLLVGVDQSSVYPASVRELPDVGYYRTLGAEGVLSLQPDLVLALEGSGPEAVLEQIARAGVDVVTIPADEHLGAPVEKVRRIASALHREDDGERLAARIEGDLERLAVAVADLGSSPRTVFIWGRGGGAMQVSGRGTAADAMLAGVGATNAIEAFDGYKPLTPEALIAARPEVIVIDGELLDRLGGVEGLATDPSLMATPALRDGRIISVEILSFIGFGPRAAATARDLVDRIHEWAPPT